MPFTGSTHHDGKRKKIQGYEFIPESCARAPRQHIVNLIFRVILCSVITPVKQFLVLHLLPHLENQTSTYGLIINQNHFLWKIVLSWWLKSCDKSHVSQEIRINFHFWTATGWGSIPSNFCSMRVREVMEALNVHDLRELKTHPANKIKKTTCLIHVPVARPSSNLAFQRRSFFSSWWSFNFYD